MQNCSIVGCKKKSAIAGKCAAHYYRAYRGSGSANDAAPRHRKYTETLVVSCTAKEKRWLKKIAREKKVSIAGAAREILFEMPF